MQVGYAEYAQPDPVAIAKSSHYNVQLSVLLKVRGGADHEIDIPDFNTLVFFLKANKDLAGDLQFSE